MSKTAKAIIAGLAALVVVLVVALVWVIGTARDRQVAPVSVEQPGQQQVQQQLPQPAQTHAPTVVPATSHFIGNSRTMKFHRADCEWAQKIADRNKVTFSNRSDATAQGYTPCSVCKP